MSYILEALRKSQQERDLGRVPTLESLPAPQDQVAAERNYWGLAAVGLATLAVVIALYAALRGTSGPGTEAQTEAVATPQAGGTPSSRLDAPTRPAVPDAPPEAGEPDGLAVPSGDGMKPDLSSEPSVPKSKMPEEPRPVRASDAPPPSTTSKSSGSVEAKDDGIPEDLREEIEAFKRQIRGEPAAEEPAEVAEVQPQDLRLPREVKERLPAFLMTVHIYDRAPEKRFVLINSRKYREGERTPQDILVEEILPDGVVLSYEGHRFFRRR